ncbi:C45 family autoproteolytic acyltransferase/hydrolase [Virgibacillus soli]|uniref:C45 family autoproteolytic acyltransferase/hydolase n=1 Tax=Paracerasibacillus soli TaxID=480284 RepID=UPI0035EFD5C9
MKQIYSDVIQFRGTHEEFGYMQGEQLKDSFILANRKKQWKVRRPRFHIDVQETKQIFQMHAPQIWSELIGLKEALQWSMEEVLQEFSGYRLEYVRSGCSIFTDQNYMVRNYDYHPKTYEGRFMLFQPTDDGYATIGPSQRITGRMDGMNEKGLVIGYNFMHRKKPGDGFICNMIARMLLENCATVDEAISFLQEIPHRHSFSYVLLDQQGETYVVEATPRQVVVRQSNMCTNHFELLTEENRFHLDDSKRRMDVIKQQQLNVTDVEKAYHMMNDAEGGVFSKEYKNWAGTIHTAVYFPKKLEVWFALGEQKKPALLSFEDWLKGKDTQIRRIRGVVDTDLPFVHMEENVR